ncbi:hypothetical protein KY321_04055, partial [Candidatus Woesearchaeota archaeon]|nr:hypothetical protein [Candidatus Woesearchaeota archaeon]
KEKDLKLLTKRFKKPFLYNKNKKEIILCSIGDVIPKWIDKVNQDICLIYYGENKRTLDKLKKKCKYFISNKNFKMPNYLLAINKFNLITKYESFIFLDDDLVVEKRSFNECFKRLQIYGLDACQPSTSRPYSHEWDNIVLQDKRYYAKITNFIECNFMCLSSKVLKKMLPYWKYFLTGFGSDLIIHKFTNQIVVFHDISFFHPKRTKNNKSKILNKNKQVFKHEKINKYLFKRFSLDSHLFKEKIFYEIKNG